MLDDSNEFPLGTYTLTPELLKMLVLAINTSNKELLKQLMNQVALTLKPLTDEEQLARGTVVFRCLDSQLEKEKKAGLLLENDFAKFMCRTTTLLQHHYTQIALTHWQNFHKKLQQSPFNGVEKLIIARFVYTYLLEDSSFSLAINDLEQLVEALAKVKAVLGAGIIRALLTAKIPITETHNNQGNITRYSSSNCISNFIKICDRLYCLSDWPALIPLVKKTLPDLEKLIEELERQQFTINKNLPLSSETLSQTMHRFQTEVSLPLSIAELTAIENDYRDIVDQILPYQYFNVECAYRAAADWRKEKYRDGKNTLITFIILALKLSLGITPYDTQLLALLVLINYPEKLKGRIAQIKTGEGKSTILAMLAVFMAVQGYFVDVITASAYLAIRDVRKFKRFFELFNISSGHICAVDHSEKNFQGQILYGVNTDFEFAYLREGVFQTEQRCSLLFKELKPRAYEVALIDEVDNLILDLARSSAILSLPDEEDLRWVYPAILKLPSIKNHHGLSAEHLRRELHQQCDERYHPVIAQLSTARLLGWQEAAISALTQKKEGRDYIVQPLKKEEDAVKDIVIVDYAHTGRLQPACQWHGGVHQFLQVRHHLAVTGESLTVASINHPHYFSRYQILMGMTGTLDERREITDLYQVDHAYIPPHYKSQWQQEQGIIAFNKQQHEQEILRVITEKSRQQRPVLLLCRTIQESQFWSQLLQRNKVKHQLINAIQTEAEDELIARAGKPGKITIATNTAGRGTDILLDSTSIKAGGLFVIFSFYPENRRVEEQGFGRAARQGQPGGGMLILHWQEDSIQQLLSTMSSACYQYLVTLSDLTKLALPMENANSSFKDSLFVTKDTSFSFMNNWPVKPKLMLLAFLRQRKTERESQLRTYFFIQENARCAYQENFFQQLAQLTKFFKEDKAKETFTEHCYSEKCRAGLSDRIIEDVPYQFLPLIPQAKALLNRPIASAQWHLFYEQFSETYLRFVRTEWARFYNCLTEANDEKTAVQQQNFFDRYFKNVEDYLLVLLGKLWQSDSACPVLPMKR